MSRPQCLVIGASGFLGTGAVPEIAGSFDVVPTSHRERGGAYRTLDARDPDAVASLVAEVKPACVAMLAAYRDPDACEETRAETYALNTRPLEVLSRVLPSQTHLLFVSTDYVFDGMHPPYHEDAERRPVNVYGESKRDAEDIVLARESAAVLRVPLLMGWTDDPGQSGFFSHLINDLKHEGPLALDHVLARYPVWTRDAGVAIRTIFEKSYTGAFHFSTSERLTRYQAAVEMGDLLGWSTDHLSPSDEIVPRKAQRPRDARLAMDRWNSLESFRPGSFRQVAASFIKQFDIQ